MQKSQVAALLHEQNFRLTQERHDLLSLFMAARKMLTPQQLHEVAHQANLQVGLTTVYRLLEVLTKVGLAAPFLLEGTIYYTFCSEQHHHHFVCLQCHHVENIYECPTFPNLTVHGTVSYHKVDLFGHCETCMS